MPHSAIVTTCQRKSYPEADLTLWHVRQRFPFLIVFRDFGSQISRSRVLLKTSKDDVRQDSTISTTFLFNNLEHHVATAKNAWTSNKVIRVERGARRWWRNGLTLAERTLNIDFISSVLPVIVVESGVAEPPGWGKSFCCWAVRLFVELSQL